MDGEIVVLFICLVEAMADDINKLAAYVNKLEMNELTDSNCGLRAYGAIVHRDWHKTTAHRFTDGRYTNSLAMEWLVMCVRLGNVFLYRRRFEYSI